MVNLIITCLFMLYKDRLALEYLSIRRYASSRNASCAPYARIDAKQARQVDPMT
jgi:hypothetical protein